MLVLTLVGAIAACIAAIPVVTMLPALWRRTVGRRRHELRQVGLLRAGERFDQVERRWGRGHDYRHGVRRGFTAAYFVSPWSIVQIVFADVSHAVVAFAVTTRHPRFTPTFRPPGGGPPAQLLVTKFVDWGEPAAREDQTVRYLAYFEEHHAGNAGDHLILQLAINPLGAGQVSESDRTSPRFRENVITSYGESLEMWSSRAYAPTAFGGDPLALRHLLPEFARGAIGDIRG